MAEERTKVRQERQALRRQLRQAGWHIGANEKRAGEPRRLALWPAPHTGPAAGVEPRWVEGRNTLDALRNAVRELQEQALAEEP